MSELEEEIEIILSQKTLKAKVKRRFNFIEKKLTEVVQKIEQQRKIVHKEYYDITVLESNTISSIFYKWFNDLELQLEKERQEYLMAILLLNSLEEEEKILSYESKILSEKYKSINVDENRLNELYKIKEQKIIYSGGKQKEIIKEKNLQIDNLNSRNREIMEAINATNETLAVFEKIHHYLNLVNDWGYMDSGGSGNNSSYKKLRFIDVNRKLILEAQHSMEILAKELEDLYTRPVIHLNIKDFDGFISIFYRHLITDWILRRKMNNAINSIIQNIDSLTTLNMMLHAEKNKNIKEIERLKKQKEKLLMK
ncbi:MAG TPA: hypothetical protein PK246_03210 [Saprospiraceae bacterium]|nr:hypothetical protein [Saprospiraceae bacterium]